MKSSASPRIALSVRAKILILFLALSLVALSLTGYFAFSAITNVGSYAQGSSEALGKGVVNDSSIALLSLGEAYLVRISADQANFTDALFKDTDAEMEILDAQTADSSATPRSSPQPRSTRRLPPPPIQRPERYSSLRPGQRRPRDRTRPAPLQDLLMSLKQYILPMGI